MLAHRLAPYPSVHTTVIAQLGLQVFGNGPIFVFLQFATATILVLAANTAYNGFPSLSSIIAQDGFLPRQLTNRGDRLVFSNGIIMLAGAASLLLVAFGGITTNLIPLYAVGVFTSFTLSQTGMVRHHLRLHEPHWRRSVVVNAVGAVATFVVLMIVAITKFKSGAWVPIAVIPAIVLVFKLIKRHYRGVEEHLRIPPDYKPPRRRLTAVVLVEEVNPGVLEALAYGAVDRPGSLRGDDRGARRCGCRADREAMGDPWGPCAARDRAHVDRRIHRGDARLHRGARAPLAEHARQRVHPRVLRGALVGPSAPQPERARSSRVGCCSRRPMWSRRSPTGSSPPRRCTPWPEPPGMAREPELLS